MSDRFLHYLISAGALGEAARLGGLSVEVLTTIGDRIVRLPASLSMETEQELSETGGALAFRFDDALIRLDEIVSATVHAAIGEVG